MQQKSKSVASPGKRYLLKAVISAFVGAALLALAFYCNSLDVPNVFTGVDNHHATNVYGCLSGFIFIAGIFLLFILPIVFFRAYRNAIATTASSGDAPLLEFFGTLFYRNGGPRSRTLAFLLALGGSYALARGLMNWQPGLIASGFGVMMLGLVFRAIVG